MIKASTIHYNPERGIVTASGDPLARKVTVQEDAGGLDVDAHHVHVTADAGLVTVETRGAPFVVTTTGDETKTVRVESMGVHRRDESDPKADA